MAWYPSDLPTFPAIPFESAQERRSDPTKVVEFSGETEQRISYAGPRRRAWEVRTPLVRSVVVDLFTAFWEERQGQRFPFKFTWRQAVAFTRFDGQFTISWRAPNLGLIEFSVKEMHPSEIIT